MNFILRFIQRRMEIPPVVWDWTAGDPEVRRLREMARFGDWRKLRTFLSDPANRPLRSQFLLASSHESTTEKWISYWLEKHGDEGDPRLVRGVRLAARAVDERDQRLFKDAEEDLFAASELSDGDHLPWTELLGISRELTHPVRECRIRFDEGRSRAPQDFRLHLAMVRCLAKHPGNAHEFMFEFARRSGAVAASLAALPAIAHVERWWYLKTAGERSLHRYFMQKDVREEIHLACHRSTSSTELDANLLANVFAFCFWKTGDRDVARTQIHKAGGVYADLPWSYAGEDEYRIALRSLW